MVSARTVGRLVDPSSGLMRCKVCGGHWTADIEPGAGRYYRGSWMCPNGCTRSKTVGPDSEPANAEGAVKG
jgi:hypothetical protein